MGEYKTLVVKICEDVVLKELEFTAKQAMARNTAWYNYDLLCNIGTLLGLLCLMPLLDSVNCLMKFVQSNHVFVSDYVAAVKICQGELFVMYLDKDSAWQQQHFEMFYDIVNDHSYCIIQKWMTDLNSGVKTLAFQIAGHTYPTHSFCPISEKKLPMTKNDLMAIITSIKDQCQDAVEMLSLKLDVHFLQVELMNALGVVFLQYWMQPNCDDLFLLHVKTLRAHFGIVSKVTFSTVQEPNEQQVDSILDDKVLVLQMSLFKLTMKSQCKAALAESRDANPLTELWVCIGQNALMMNRLSEFFKVAKIAICIVLGSVTNERTFSTLSFMKSKL